MDQFQPVPGDVKLKDPKDFVYIGKGVPRTDSRAKCNGTAMFTQDVRLPNLLTAVVAHPPRPQRAGSGRPDELPHHPVALRENALRFLDGLLRHGARG